MLGNNTNSDAKLVALLSTRDANDRYSPYVQSYTTLEETGELLSAIKAYFKANLKIDTIVWDDFIVWFKVVHKPLWSNSQYQLYETIIDAVKQQTPDPLVVERFIDLDAATKIKESADLVLKGGDSTNINDIEDILSDYHNKKSDYKTEDFFITDDLNAIMDSVVTSGGMEWGLEELNVSVGQVHPTDFVILGKRPEVGGTTFITDQFACFLPQLPAGKDAIIFNNEEGGSKVRFRMMQSALQMSTGDMLADIDDTKYKWEQFLGTKKYDLFSKSGFTTKDAERVLRTGNYGLIAINVLEKVGGFYKEDAVERRRRLAEWCRNLAGTYDATVFAVVQADASAEGLTTLNQSQLYGSKTGLQGEGDVLLMIGKSNEAGKDGERWINICKNKKPTTGRMNPQLKHSVHPVDFDVERGTYISRMK